MMTRAGTSQPDVAARERLLTGLQSLALGALLLSPLGEPFGGLSDGARVQLRDDPPRLGCALPGLLSVGFGVGNAEGAAHLTCLLRPIHLDGEAIPLDGLP